MSYMTTSERQSVLTAEIAAVNNRQAFAQALVRIAEAFGFKYATLMDAPTTESFLLKSLLIESNLPPAYVSAFDRSRFMQLPLFSAGVSNSAVPRLWSLSDKTTVIPDELRDLKFSFDIHVGISLPAYCTDGQRLLFWFAGTRAQLGQAEVNEMTVLMLQALDAFNLVKSAKSDHPPLSAREREVVRWTSQGKTSIEIGQILSLSDHTVNAYMTSAIKKLDCVNRTQLVAKAIRYKLIT
ncbi:LuxR family transcriptional regulator [Rhizobium sp. 2MFCol3.1]|uniref:helix-turn-helix transcriptional regulator n=1 Tax=Rhizobium sp. 2MFCol3.1 TaxID=1246459 RepID=UPI0003A5B507|nr:LuxR family transcriptional regulator [Rhizobium sp. 2MFCol3.1]